MSNEWTLDRMKAAFAANESAKDSFSNNYYPFWQMNEGEHAVVRFLPDANMENPMGWFVEKRMHNLVINGEKKSVPCMTMYGDDDCPICKVSSAFYDKGDEDSGKAYWRKRQYLTQAIVVTDPLQADQQTGETHEGKVRLLALGFQLYNIIKDATMTGELDTVPFLFKNGVDFIIKKSKQGKFSSYALGSKFMRTNRDLTDDEIAMAQESMIDLATLLPRKPTVEFLQEQLSASLNGESTVSASSYNTDTTTDTTVAAEDAGYQAKTDDGAGGDEAEKILAEIRDRKKTAG